MPASADPDSPATESILLVDDSPTNLDLLVQALAGCGQRLLIARNGEDALRIAAEARPAVILLDIMMPGIDGYETCRRLKADPETAGTQVVFLSAKGEVEDKVHGLELGAIDYIAKPFDVGEVVARVAAHMRNWRRQRRLEEAARGGGDPEDWWPPDADTLREWIGEGEGERLEFKSTIRWNLRAGKVDKAIEQAWLKGVVAYLNSEGGRLLIGVADDGEVVGIELDNFPNDDKCQLYLSNLVREGIGLAFAPYIKFSIIAIDGRKVVAVECRPAPDPVFLKTGKEELFFIRVGPSSRKLSISEALVYIKNRGEG